jgi:hypothetical protein
MTRVLLPLGLLLVSALVAMLGPLAETRQRAPEATARAYLRALEQGEIDAALAVIEPSARAALRERVAWQQGNRYEIVTVVLGRPSVVDRLMGRQLPAAWAIVTAEVTTVSGERWRSTSTAGLVEQGGVWYLLGPLFA